MTRIIQIVNKLWDSLSTWGVRPEMPFTLRRRIILSNQICIGLSVIISALAIITPFFFDTQYAWVLFAPDFVIFVAVLLLNRTSHTYTSRVILSVSPSLFALISTLVDVAWRKYFGVPIELLHLIVPRLIILASSALPLVLLNFTKKRQIFFNLILPFAGLVFFDLLHNLIGIRWVDHLPINQGVIWLLNVAFTTSFLIITASFFLLQGINIAFEEKITKVMSTLHQKNKNLRKQKTVLNKAYRKLKQNQQDIETQKKRIEEQNEAIKAYSKEVIVKKEAMQLHSEILMRLLRGKHVQQGLLDFVQADITELSTFTLDISRVSLWRYQAQKQEMVLLDAFERATGTHFSGHALQVDQYEAFFEPILNQKMIKANDVYRSRTTQVLTENYLTPNGIRSMLAFSYFVEGSLGGMVCFEQQQTYRRWTEEDISFLISLADVFTLTLATYKITQTLAQLHRQKEALSEQHLLLVQNQQELLQAQQIIQDQNQALQHYNTDLQQAIARKAQELQEASRELDTFIYRASHDLKGPLATFQGLCQIALIDATEAVSLHYFGILQNTSNKMQNVLDTLLRVVEIKDMEVERNRINLRSLLQRILNQIRLKENLDHFHISFKLSAKEIVIGDAIVLGIIFENVLKNAVQFQPKYNPSHIPHIWIQITNPSEGKTLVEIIDNGIGVAPEDEDRIFDMFFKGSDQSKGAGLGLYMAKAAIQKLGGAIGFRRSAENFSIFSIEIPQ